MLRLDEKSLLIKKYCDSFSTISRYTGQINPGEYVKGSYLGCLPKRAVRVLHNSLTRDLFKGLKIIDKKFPVYIELPTLKEEGDGMYSENHNNSDNKSDKEIIVGDSPKLPKQEQQILIE